MKKLLSCIILIMIVLSGCSRKPESNVDLLDNKDFFDAEILEVGNEYNSDENRVYICDTMFADREFFIERFHVKNADDTEHFTIDTLYSIEGLKKGEIRSC